MEILIIQYLVSLLPLIAGVLTSIATFIVAIRQFKKLVLNNEEHGRQVRKENLELKRENAEIKKDLRKLHYLIYQVADDGKDK